MKLYYKTLSKEEKQKIKIDFLKKKDSTIYKKSTRIITVCIFGMVFSIASLIFDLLYKMGAINYILDLILFIFCTIFLFAFINIQIKEINKFALKKANK